MNASEKDVPVTKGAVKVSPVCTRVTLLSVFSPACFTVIFCSTPLAESVMTASREVSPVLAS